MDEMTGIHAVDMAELKVSLGSKIIDLRDSLDYGQTEIRIKE